MLVAGVSQGLLFWSCPREFVSKVFELGRYGRGRSDWGSHGAILWGGAGWTKNRVDEEDGHWGQDTESGLGPGVFSDKQAQCWPSGQPGQGEEKAEKRGRGRGTESFWTVPIRHLILCNARDGAQPRFRTPY